MDSNIRTGGEPVKESTPAEGKEGLVAWINQQDYLSVGGIPEEWGEYGNNNKGPITAMNYLEEATKDWTNTNEVKISEFTDKTGKSYTITKTYNTYARMPYNSEVNNVSTDKLWLIDYLDSSEDEMLGVVGRTGVNKVYGYWIFSTDLDASIALRITYVALVSQGRVNNETFNGVRPVINLKI